MPSETFNDISAVSEDTRWDVWLSGAPAWLKNDATGFAFNGYGVSTLTGIDYNFGNGWIAGFDAGYVRTDVKVQAMAGNRVVNGAQAGPYATYIISDVLTANASFSYTRSVNDTNGNNNGLGVPANSSYYSNSYSGTAALNAYGVWNGFGLTGTLGFTYSADFPTTLIPQPIGGVATTVHTGSLAAVGQVDYRIDKFDPYIPISVIYLTTPTQDGTGRTGLNLGIGTRYYFDNKVQASFQVTTQQFRSHSQNVTGIASLYWTF